MRGRPSTHGTGRLRPIVFAAVMLMSSACFGQSDGPAGAAPVLVTVRMANLAVGVGTFVQDLAVEKGIFARHGIDLQVVNFIKGGAEAMAGTASGQVDMGAYGTPILTGISFGLPIKIVGSSPNKRMNFELVARKGIDSVAALKGKVVACGALGGGNHQALIKILRDNGLSENDVGVVATGGTDAEMILRSGKVEAVVTTELARRKIENEGVGTLIAKARDYYGRYQHSFVFATNDFIRRHPEAVRNYFLATRESLDYAKSHLDELVAFAARRSHIKPEIIRGYYQEQMALWDTSFAVDQEGTANAVEILKGMKELKANVAFDPATWLDLRFLN